MLLKRGHLCVLFVICIFSVDNDDDADDAATAAAVALFLLERDAELNMRLTGGKQKLDYLLASIADYSAPRLLHYFIARILYMVERGIRNFSNLSVVWRSGRAVS